MTTTKIDNYLIKRLRLVTSLQIHSLVTDPVYTQAFAIHFIN